MTAPAVHLPYLPLAGIPGSLMPRLPLTLRLRERSAAVVGLLDTGSAINFLPYAVGVALGAVWEQQTMPVPLAGSLGQTEACALIVDAEHPQLTQIHPARLVFAWTKAEEVPIIFGQVNFFLAFDVCFYRAEAAFEIRPR